MALQLSKKISSQAVYALCIPSTQFVVCHLLKPAVSNRPNVTGSFTCPRKFDLFFGDSTFGRCCPAHSIWQRWKLYVGREALERYRHGSSSCLVNPRWFSRCGKVLFSRAPRALEE